MNLAEMGHGRKTIVGPTEERICDRGCYWWGVCPGVPGEMPGCCRAWRLDGLDACTGCARKCVARDGVASARCMALAARHWTVSNNAEKEYGCAMSADEKPSQPNKPAADGVMPALAVCGGCCEAAVRACNCVCRARKRAPARMVRATLQWLLVQRCALDAGRTRESSAIQNG